MFFNQELLTSRKSGFGICWIAATLTTKTSLKRIGRRELMSFSIEEFCEVLQNPPEPLALRLSSNLLVGVARVYDERWKIFSSEVQQVYANVRKAVGDLKQAGGDGIDLPNVGAKHDAITLQIGDDGIALGIQLDFADAGWEDFAGFTFGDDLVDSSQIGRGSTPALVAPDSQLLLQEDHHGLFVNQDARAGGGDGLGDEGFDNLEGVGDIFQGELDQFKIDGEGSTVGGLAAGRGTGISSSVGGRGGMDDWEGVGEMGGDQTALEGGEIEEQFRGEEMDIDWGDAGRLQERVEGEHAEGEEAVKRKVAKGRKRKYSETGEALPLSDGDEDQSVAPRSILKTPGQTETDAGKTAETARKKGRKKKVTIVDGTIELTDAELARARNKYSDEMDRLAAEAAAKECKKRDAAIAHQLVFGPPQGFAAPALLEFYAEMTSGKVRATLEDVQTNELKGKRRRTGSLADDAVGRDGDAAWAAGAAEGEFPVPVSDDWPQQDGQDYIQDYPMDYPQDVEFGRVPVGEQQDVELGRGSGSQHSDRAPWEQFNAAPTADSDTGVGFIPGGGRSSQTGTAAGRFSMDTPVRGRARESSVGAMFSSQQVTPKLAGRPGSAMGGTGEAVDFGGFEELEEPEGTHPSQDHTPPRLEQKSAQFLAYVKHCAQTEQEESGFETLYFSDICPPASSTRHVAAEGFYHVLLLAGKSIVKCKQDEPKGPIEIAIV